MTAQQDADFAAFARMNGHGPAADLPSYKLASEIPPERITWIWYGYLAEGKITIMDGNPKLGKSLLTTDLCARISRGEAFPLSPDITRPGVVMLSGEDGVADTIIPRLMVAGAQMEKVAIVSGMPTPLGAEGAITLSEHLPQIEALISHIEAGLIIIDPISVYLGKEVNAYRDQDVRSVLMPLKEMVERQKCAAMIVRHLNRGAGTDIISRGSMSLGFTGAARLGMLIAQDPEDEVWRVLAQSLTNISAQQPSLRFRIEAVPDTDVARVVWDTSPSHYSAMQLLEGAVSEEEKGARSEAEAWLEDFLRFGPAPAKDVQKAARGDGHSERTLDRAKVRMGVKSVKDAFSGGWKWHLPRHIPQEGQPVGEVRVPSSPSIQKAGTLRTSSTYIDILGAKNAKTKNATPDEEGRRGPGFQKKDMQAPLIVPWEDL